MLVAIEGIDGSGKGTQAALLVDNLLRRGCRTRLFSFPCYEETFFGREVGRYLNGQFGDLHSIPVEFAAMLYAGDRFEKRESLFQALKAGEVVICDRYVPSNLVYQGAKAQEEQQPALLDWIARLEYGVFGLPRPDMVFLLDMPVEQSVRLVLNKKKRSYTDEKLDLHEAASAYLENVHRLFGKLARKEGWRLVHSMDGERLRSVDEIAQEISEATIAALGSST